MIPQIRFRLSRVVNEFCRLSVLYADLLPAELRAGMLDNKGYRERNHHLRQDHIRLELQRIGPFVSESGWYEFARGLMKRDQSGGFESLSDNSKFAETFGQIRQLKTIGFERIWRETRPRLEEYKNNFSSKWSPISDRVLSRLSTLAKTPWWTEKIRVHFIDCLNGGFAWSDSVGFATLPDMEVQKKFLALSFQS